MRFGVCSDKGKIREVNEDSYNIMAGYSGVPVSFIIADGMGGHNSGEIASKAAVDFVSKYLLQFPDLFSGKEDVSDRIREVVEKANEHVLGVSREDEANFGMGTTLVIAVVHNKKLYIAHIGDSRAYILRMGGINRITTDHSYIEELLRNGNLTMKEAEHHPQKNIITRALGCFEKVEVDTYTCNVKENDIFILCTDGLTNMVEEEEIKKIVLENDDPDIACRKLVDRANESGGEDNITVIVFKNN